MLTASSGVRVLSHDEFVARMLAWKARQRAQKARNPRVSAKAAPRTQGREKRPKKQYVDYSKVNRYRRAVVRDDGVAFECIGDALQQAGYARTSYKSAQGNIEKGRPWKDGHVYRWGDRL